MTAIKENITKYSGLPLSALIHLVSTKAPVNELYRREVWKELFYRYFMDGRMFNLYKILKGKPEMFANTIGWELQREDVEVPIAHAEAFMENLLAFIQYIDKKVLESGVQFEWQLHELQGLKNMIERVRDAKIKDTNLRQKINLFIDKINNTRKKSLVLIEQAKKEQAEKKVTENELVIVQNGNEVVVNQQKQELMKQQLKQLSIPISKMTKTQWEKAVDEFHLFYPQDQDKLLKLGLKKYSFFQINHLSLLAFKKNLEWKIPNVPMVGLLLRSLSSYKKAEELFGSKEALYRIVKEWYQNSKGSTEEGWNQFSTNFLMELGGTFANEKLLHRTIQKMQSVYPIVQSYHGKNLSDLLEEKVTVRVPKNRYGHSTAIKYSKEEDVWVADETGFVDKEITVLEHFYRVFNYIRDRGRDDGFSLVDYRIETIAESEIRIMDKVPYSVHQLIREFCHFPSTLLFDEGVNTLLLTDSSVQPLLPTFDGGGALQDVLKVKYNTNSVSDKELVYLFKTEEGQKVFNAITKHLGTMQGWLLYQSDFMGKVFDRLLRFFDFSQDNERELFFRLPFQADDFYKGYGLCKKEHAQWIVEKLQTEAPHEYHLVAEYFSEIDESYESYESHPLFEYLSDFERLLLEREGVQTGKIRKHQGYKEGTVEYTSGEARNKFVIEYFQKLVEKEG